VLTTIHAANGDQGRRVYTFLRDDLEARFIQFIPIIERATEQTLPAIAAGWGERTTGRPLYRQQGDLVSARSVGSRQYGRFMIDVFEEWVRRDVGSVYVQLFDTTLGNFSATGGGMCVHAPSCGDQLAMEHNGDVYSCDHFVEPAYLLGNITQRPLLELVRSAQQRAFGQDKLNTLPRYCRGCDVRFACNGGCPKDRFATTPDGEPGLHYLCAGYQDFFRHVAAPMRQMAGLLRQGRAPRDVMASYAEADQARSRNDPCTCGRGIKWKRCHGATSLNRRRQSSTVDDQRNAGSAVAAIRRGTTGPR
jgi:uncharacterized protein